MISVGLFAVYYFDARSALHRYILTPLLRHTLDPETSHNVAVKVLGSGFAPRDPLPDDKRLRIQVGGTCYLFFRCGEHIPCDQIWDEELSNPVGLAAGFDKHGEAIDGE